MVDKITDLPGLSGWEAQNRVTVDGVQYTPSELQASRTRTGANIDPYNASLQRASKIASTQAPKVVVNNGRVSISAPQSILDSPYVSQLKQELQTLKGSDLQSPEVLNSIEKLNEEIQTNFRDITVQSTMDWTPDEYKDYQYAIQTMSSTNPLKSSNLIKGKDKNGDIVSKKPQDWINYWREVYNTDERVDALAKSTQSSNPYERTMYLIMTQGTGTPVYGFDTFERIQQGIGAFANQMKKLPEGAVRLIGTDSNTRAIEDRANTLKISRDALMELSDISNEDKFNQMKDSIRGKTWSELSDQQRAFVLELGVSKQEPASLNNRASREIAAGLPIPAGYHEQSLNNMSSENETNSRLGIESILNDSSYDKFRETRDNYITWQNYDRDVSQDDERLARNAIMSSAEQGIGSVAGSIGRFLWEAAVTRGLTGGVSPKSITNPRLVSGGAAAGFNINAISDTLGGKIVNTLANKGFSPASRFGQNLLQFTATLAGTIPEDILQTSLDNVLTYHIEDNKHLLDFDQMSDNFKNNLIVMSLFNAARTGSNAVKRARIAKALKAQTELNQTMNIDGIMSDTDDLARAIKNGNEVKVDSEKVSVVGDDGNEVVLKNITPEQGDMIQASLLGDTATPVEVADTLKPGDKIQILVDYGGSNEWWNAEVVEDGGKKYIVGDGFEDKFDVDSPMIEQIRTMDGSPIAKSAPKPVDYGTESYINREKTKADLIYERSLVRQNLNELEARKQRWVNNDYEDEFGNDVRVRETNEFGTEEIEGSSKLERIDTEINAAKNRIQQLDDAIDNAPENVEIETPKLDTSKIEPTETPKSETTKVNYEYAPLNDAMSADIRPNQADIRDWHTRTHTNIMNDFDNNFINKFHNKFGDVQASDFDWVWYQSKQGKTPAEIIGTTDPTTGRVITQNMIDAMEWWAEQPQTKALRRASRDALGLEGDFNVLGYLPHTDYDPSYTSFEEAMSGALWQTSTGASIMDEGQYKGYGGDFRDRYSTFVSNMLWDARSKDVATAKLLDEARMDGQEVTPELEANARKAVEGERDIRRIVNDSDSTKAVVKALESTTEDAEDINWKKIDEETKKQAEKSGLGQAIHDNYRDIYYGANSYNVGKQGNAVVNSFDTLGNRMRNTTIGNGLSMYDWGGADIVYAPRNAIDLVNRYLREGGDFREMLQEYVENHSHRSPEYAEEVVDKWMGKLGELSQKGPLTKGAVIQSLSSSMKWEGMTRLKKWLTMANYSQFNSSTKKMIDRFLFNHMQMDTIKHNPTISQRLTKGLNDLTALRYRALFYGNIKNALLQVSELNRYFSSFKWGDVATMAKRLVTDEGFRARVDDYVQSVAPMTNRLKADIYQAYADVAGNMKVDQDGVKFKDLGKKAKDTADAIGLAPIEAAEAYKNRMMVAGLVQEADRLGLTGDEALRHIRNRFERVALAADEMGQIGMASNPLAKTMLFLQNFQIRELGMHLYNIKDATGMAKTVPGKVLAATNYLTKVFGAKLATTLILARLGYSANQTMGIDPFGLLDQYNELDREDMELPDYFFMSPFFSGGMTSLISDMYFMARKAYEDSNQETVSDEAEQKLEPSWGLAIPNISFDNVMGAAADFIPGSVFANRIGQMNEMMDTGWATSATGNKMYTAPNDAVNTLLGYLFGRSATQNAQQYRQTYGDNLWQTLGRFNPFREYTEFDPIDTKNYTDWFKGDANDRQQFEKGRRYFQNERDRIIDTYESVVSKSYVSDEELAEAKNSMNSRLNELYDSLERFVDAYEAKNGTIDAAMAKQVINLLNTGRRVMGDTAEESSERSLEEYNKALGRYSDLGLSPVGTYTGATESEPEKETRYQGSPQWRAAVSGYYNISDEAVEVLKQADKTLAPIRKQISSAISDAYNKKNYDEVERIQRDYLDEFDNVVSPIIAAYGNSIFNSTDVTNQIKDMLSTGTNSRSGNLIPSDDYRKDKYGRYRSMPFETVDVKKWAQQRFSGNRYKNPTIRSNSTAEEDIKEIKRLYNGGQKSSARARALQLKVRVDNQTRSLNNEQYKWLNNFLEGEK